MVVVSLTSAWRAAPAVLAVAAAIAFAVLPVRRARRRRRTHRCGSWRKWCSRRAGRTSRSAPIGCSCAISSFTRAEDRPISSTTITCAEFVDKNPACADRAAARGARSARTRTPACASSDSLRSAISTRVRFSRDAASPERRRGQTRGARARGRIEPIMQRGIRCSDRCVQRSARGTEARDDRSAIARDRITAVIPQLAGIEDAVRIERVLDALSSARSRRVTARGQDTRAFAKPMPCSPEIDPSSATTPSNSSRSASAARRISSGVAGIDHQVDVDVAVAGVPEARDQQTIARGGRARSSSNSAGTRPRGTTTS